MGLTMATLGDATFSELAGTAATAAASAAPYVAAGTAVAGAAGAFSRKPVIPPAPMMSAQGQDQSTQAVEAAAMRRQSIAGGANSTIGTAGGNAGSVLNPANLGGKSLLGQ